MQTDATKEVQTQHKKPASAVIIANPTSGSYTHHANQVKEALNNLRKHGWKAELWLTQEAGDARKLSKKAVEQQIDVVVAAGGDGTINEVIQELANSDTALGIFPLGTVNVWARETGIPLDKPVKASEILLQGYTRRVDLGKLEDRYFLLMAGIGLDGEVTSAVEKRPAKRLGVVGYLLVAAWMGLGFKGYQVTLRSNNQEIKTRALQIIIGNTQLYGGALKFTWQAKCDDGLLDVCIVRKRGLIGRTLVVIDFLLRREQRRQWVTYQKGSTIEVQTRHPVAIQIDGEPAEFTTPATFSVAPRVLKVIIPQEATQKLFARTRD